MKTYRIILKSCRDELQKVELDKLLATDADLGLADAKKLVDRLLDGEEVSVLSLSQKDAELLAKKIEGLGANCTIEEEVGHE